MCTTRRRPRFTACRSTARSGTVAVPGAGAGAAAGRARERGQPPTHPVRQPRLRTPGRASAWPLLERPAQPAGAAPKGSHRAADQEAERRPSTAARLRWTGSRHATAARRETEARRSLPSVPRSAPCDRVGDDAMIPTLHVTEMGRAISAVGLSNCTSTVEAGATDRRAGAAAIRPLRKLAEARCGRPHPAFQPRRRRVPSSPVGLRQPRSIDEGGRGGRLGKAHDTGFRVVMWTYICALGSRSRSGRCGRALDCRCTSSNGARRRGKPSSGSRRAPRRSSLRAVAQLVPNALSVIVDRRSDGVQLCPGTEPVAACAVSARSECVPPPHPATVSAATTVSTTAVVSFPNTRPSR